MTFERVNFNDEMLNKLADEIVTKAEKQHTDFEDASNLPTIMESGSYLGNEFFQQTISSFNLIKSKKGIADERVKLLSEIIAVTSITLARFNCQHANALAMASDFKSQPEPVIKFLKIAVEDAISLIEKIRPMEMSSRARNLLNETSSLGNLALKRLSKTGCFIATFVYQDFNHPNIYILRKFRDNQLKKTLLGRFFISAYYELSPVLINLLGHKAFFRKISHTIINFILKLLK